MALFYDLPVYKETYKLILLIILINSISTILFAQSSDSYTSEFHKQNVGKISFSDKPI